MDISVCFSVCVQLNTVRDVWVLTFQPQKHRKWSYLSWCWLDVSSCLHSCPDFQVTNKYKKKNTWKHQFDYFLSKLDSAEVLIGSVHLPALQLRPVSTLALKMRPMSVWHIRTLKQTNKQTTKTNRLWYSSSQSKTCHCMKLQGLNFKFTFCPLLVINCSRLCCFLPLALLSPLQTTGP